MSMRTQFNGLVKGVLGWLTAPNTSSADQEEDVIYFTRTQTITSAAAATAVSLIADSEVPPGWKAYLTDCHAKVNGATNWATTATVKVQDTNGAPVDFVTMAVAALTGNSFVGKFTSNITAEAALARNTGGTAGKGLQLKGDANGTGSDLVVTVVGYLKGPRAA